MRFKKLLPPLALALAIVLPGRDAGAQTEPLNQPAPLARPAVGPSPGDSAVSLANAQRAQELGLPTLAAAEYRKLFELPGADRAGLTLALATALLDAGSAAEAETVLNAFVGLRGAAWHLRAGLAAAQLRKFDVARAALAAAKLDDLGLGDRPWWYFLSGLVADAANDVQRANEAYKRAQDLASTELSRARFMLASERTRLQRFGTVDEAQLRQAQQNFQRFPGTATGYGYARSYAVMLEAMPGNRAENHRRAVEFLQQQLLALPPTELSWLDEFRLLLGLIADPTREVAGRNALTQLLERGTDPDKQRMALQLLANAAQGEAARAAFRAELDKLLGAPTVHPITESLLLFSAQAALAEKTTEGYARAERDARELNNKFPASRLRVQAFSVLTASAWEQRRYRTAAGSAQRARAGLVNAERPEELAARAKLGVLEAEAWFRAGEAAGDAGDYRAAAEAYAAALRERPADVPAGDLMFQRVLAEIRAGTPESAEPLLDELARDPAFDLEPRWQAEWNLARALQVREKTAAAYARVNRLLAAAPAVAAQLKPELRARMQWLQARLSLESGQPAETLKFAAGLTTLPGDLDAGLRTEIVNSAALLTAEANFRLGDEPAALKALQEVRTKPESAKSDAAVRSFIIEANHYAQQDKAVDALKLLRKLAEDFADNKHYAPYALFQAALQSERLGQDKNFQDAITFIEELVTKYPQSELVFAARLKQGGLLRKLNFFPQAQRVYEDVVNKFPQHGDVIYARLALAETINAQGAGSPAHIAQAQALFEQLRDRVDAPVDVRVEAGYNLGEIFVRDGKPQKALEVWWDYVVMPFLVDEKARATPLGATGRFWMARTLLKVAEAFEKVERLEEAQRAWRLVIESKLGHGESIAQGKLERFKSPEARP
jgi:outer membrane protein assembly factor BamD (BamD/ComL family)